MAKIRYGGYVFLSWKGDHNPHHVHVFLDGKLIVKWDLDNEKVMKGKASLRVRELIKELQAKAML